MIEWNEGLNLGIKALDDDHKRLLQLINSLSESIDKNEPKNIIEHIFLELEKLTKKHFEREEDYLEGCSCTKLDEHKVQHADFLSKLSELKNKALSANDYISIQDVTVYLTEWLLNHVIEEDIPTITVFQKCGLTQHEEKKDKSLLEKLIKITTDRFSFTKRIFLSAIVPLSGMLLFGTIIIVVNFNEYLNMKRTSTITNMTSTINELVHNLQIERGLSSGYLTSISKDRFKQSLHEQRKIVDNIAKNLSSKVKSIQLNNLILIKTNIKILQEDLLSLNNIRKDINDKEISKKQTIDTYSNIIKNLLNITPKIATLNLNKELSSSIATLSSIQLFKESIGRERAYGTAILEKKDVTIDEYAPFIELIGTQIAFLNTFEHTASEKQKTSKNLLINSYIAKQIQAYEKDIKNYNFNNLDSKVWFKSSTHYINKIKLFEDDILQEINALIDKNIDSTVTNFFLWITFNTIILAINLFILYTFKKSTVLQIDKLTNAMRDLATGGRGFRLSPINMNRDEIAYMYDAYETTRQKLLKGDIYTQLYLSKNKIELKNKERENIKLEEMAFIDPLTGTVNRRKFEELSNKEIERSNRYKTNLSFLMMDIDHFKHINDNYGHAIGDEVLKHFASVCLEMARSLDVVARIGGEEFVVMLPETTSNGAYKFAERFRKEIYTSELNIDGKDIRYTVSVGLSCLNKNKDLKSVLQRADQALYRAKESGRNRTVINK
ncbi:MAG: bacteriohemerythrin [Thiovulaceae bacterium]|nr:bacteriohemerythrin [Sulfurimonadaceae bacterium]